MRVVVFVLFILFFSGCLDSTLSGTDLQTCLESTHTSLLHVPACNSPETCQEEWRNGQGMIDFEHVPVAAPVRIAEQSVVNTWLALNQAQETFEEVNAACSKESAQSILAKGTVAASRLRSALKESEAAQQYAWLALQQAIESAKKEELEVVKDSPAFAAYAKGLEWNQELVTDSPQNDEVREMSEDQAYFEQLGALISKKDPGSVSMDLPSAFKLYDTALGSSAFDGRGGTIPLFSPVFESALSVFSSLSNMERGISLLHHIRAGEIIQHVENSVDFENGMVTKIISTIRLLEEGIVSLETEEKIVTVRLREKIEVIEEKIAEHRERESRGSAMKAVFDAWSHAWAVPGEWERVGFEEELAIVHALREKMEFIERAKETKAISLGKRVNEWRNMEHEANEIDLAIGKKENRIHQRIESCGVLVQKVNEENKSVSIFENKINEGSLDEKMDACFSFLDELEKSRVEYSVSEKVRSFELESCVHEIEKFENAGEMEGNFHTAEWFVGTFGVSGALPACESERQGIANAYFSQEGYHVLIQNRNELERFIRALEYATQRRGGEGGNSEAWKESVRNADEVMKREELDELNEKIEEQLVEAKREAERVLQEEASKIVWNVFSKEPVYPGIETDAEWVGKIDNPFGGIELDFPFVIEVRVPAYGRVSEIMPELSWGVDGEEIIVEGNGVSTAGISIRGNGNGVWVHVNELVSLRELIGTKAYVTSFLDVETQTPMNVTVRWRAPEGIENESISVGVEGINVPFQLGSFLELPLSLTKNKTRVEVKYALRNAVGVNVSLVSSSMDKGQQQTEYLIVITNQLGQEIDTDLSIGIPANPLLMDSVEVEEEDSGRKVKTRISPLLGLVMENIVLHEGETREYRARLVMREDGGAWETLVSVLRSEIEVLRRSEYSKIRMKAESLSVELSTLHHEMDVDKRMNQLPTFHTKVEALKMDAAETRFAYEKWLSELEKRKKKIEKMSDGETKEEMRSQIERAKVLLKMENIPSVEKIMKEIDEQLQTKIVENIPEKIIDLNIVNQDPKLVLEKVVRALSELENYENALGISCDKLSETGFVCPLGKIQLDEIKTKLKKNKTELEKGVKKWDLASSEKKSEMVSENRGSWSQIGMEAEQAEKTGEDAAAVLEEAAGELLNQLELSVKSGREDVKASAEKARVAFSKKEWGKTIYISQNLLGYMRGNSPLSGLTTLPMVAWPLIGVALVSGGIWYYRNEKKKNEKPKEWTTIPREKTATAASLAENVRALERRPTQGERPTVRRKRGALKTLPRSEKPSSSEEHPSPQTWLK